MKEITTASAEQQIGIEHINQALGQMDEITQQNATLVEEAAAAAESMREQTLKLSETVAVFKLANDAQSGIAIGETNIAYNNVTPLTKHGLNVHHEGIRARLPEPRQEKVLAVANGRC